MHKKKLQTGLPIGLLLFFIFIFFPQAKRPIIYRLDSYKHLPNKKILRQGKSIKPLSKWPIMRGWQKKYVYKRLSALIVHLFPQKTNCWDVLASKCIQATVTYKQYKYKDRSLLFLSKNLVNSTCSCLFSNGPRRAAQHRPHRHSPHLPSTWDHS